ncbi:MAG: hypothetical protein WD250_01640 [Egibacteraceae bacterium]
MACSGPVLDAVAPALALLSGSSAGTGTVIHTAVLARQGLAEEPGYCHLPTEAMSAKTAVASAIR